MRREQKKKIDLSRADKRDSKKTFIDNLFPEHDQGNDSKEENCFIDNSFPEHDPENVPSWQHCFKLSSLQGKAMQGKAIKQGEPLTLRVIMDFDESSSLDEVFSLDIDGKSTLVLSLYLV